MPAPVDVRPTFRRIYDHLLDRIARGEWRPGEGMPGEQAFAREYQVSVGTIRKALDVLQTEGVIDRHRGRGTAVSRRTPENTRFSYFRFRSATGALQVPVDRVLSRGSAPATVAEGAALALPAGRPVHRIRRVRMIEGEAFSVDSMVFDAGRFPDFSWPAGAEADTVYAYLERQFGVLVTFVQERIRAIRLGPVAARHLHRPVDAPVLEVTRMAFDLSGTAVEFRRSTTLTESQCYLSELRQAKTLRV